MTPRTDEPEQPGSPPEGAEGELPVVDELETERVERAAESAEADEVARANATGAPPEAALAEMRDKWLRAEADIQNVRRRAAREREEQRREIEDQWLLELASLEDDLERARATAREAGAPESWTRGVDLVHARIGELLARHGVAPIDPLGEPFDPKLHEALVEIDAPEGAKPGSVVQVVSRGFSRGGRPLRAARVVVARQDGAAS